MSSAVVDFASSKGVTQRGVVDGAVSYVVPTAHTSGWNRRKLGDLCYLDKQQGIHRDLPYVGLEHIESGTGKFLGVLDGVSVKSSTFRFNPQHILYGRLRSYLNKVLLPDFTGHCSTEIFPIKPKNDVLRKFLFYWLTREQTVQAVDATSTGTRMPRANMGAVLEFELMVPSLKEQQCIVAILDEAFAGIAKARVNAEQSLRNARELFESHLQTVFTRHGEGWVGRTLREIAVDFGRGKSKHRPRNDLKLYGGPYPFIQTGDVRGSRHLITDYSQTYSEAGLTQSKLWPKGTLCITIAANIAETGILDFDACFPDSVIGVVVNTKLTSTKFLEYLLQSFKAVLQAQGKGSAQANINLATFENQRFPFPSLPMQKSIVAKLDALAAETHRLESIYQQKLAALDELKQSLLDRAFSGAL